AEELPRLPLRPLMPPGSLTIVKMAAAVLPITPQDEAGRYRARHCRSLFSMSQAAEQAVTQCGAAD
ncbi:hypothetical protein ABTN25_20385, partial [Acinetobacter baumannii]